MKHKVKKPDIVTVLGFILLIIGLSIVIGVSLHNYKIKSNYKNALEDSKYFNDKTIEDGEIQHYYTDGTNDYIQYEGFLDLNGIFEGEEQDLKKVDNLKSVIQIPSLNIEAYVYDDISRDSLIYGVGRYPESVNIGEKGNCVIAGHSSSVYDCIFNGLSDIALLDTFILYDKEGKEHKYYVIDKQVIEPYDLHILDETYDGLSQVTLFTCTNGGKQRYVVIGKELNDEDFQKYKEYLKSNAIKEYNNIINNLEFFNFGQIFDYNTTQSLELNREGLNQNIIKYETKLIKENKEEKKEHIYPEQFNLDFGVEVQYMEVN